MKDFKILLVYPNDSMMGVVPSNLALLSACLKQAGFKTSLFDTSLFPPADNEETLDDLRTRLNHVKPSNVESYYEYVRTDMRQSFINTVQRYKPDLIAITVVDGTIARMLTLLKALPNRLIPVIAGGVGAIFSYEKILRSGLVDWICIGEGEETVVELCQKLAAGQDCTAIKNLCYLNDGSIIKNDLRPLVDLNSLPYPDFSIYHHCRFYRPFRGRVVRMVQVDIDRGCPYDCTYCAAPALRKINESGTSERYFRRKSVTRIVDEIKYLVNCYDLNFLWFSSETFFCRPYSELREFAERYIAEIAIPFWCQTRLDTCSEESTALLEKMGCQAVTVGLEHGNEQIRRQLLNKNISNKRVLEAARILSRFNIPVTFNTMIGLPDETRDNVFESIAINRKLARELHNNSSCNVFIFTPYCGTHLRELCIEKGYCSPNVELPFSFLTNSVLDMPTLTREEILGLERTFHLYARLPRKYFSEIKIAEQGNHEGQQAFSRLSLAVSKMVP